MNKWRIEIMNVWRRREVEGVNEILTPSPLHPLTPAAVRGFTMLELILVITVLTLFTAIAIPMTKNSARRQKEIELGQALHTIRTAIDRYRQLAENGCVKNLSGRFASRTELEQQCMLLAPRMICYPLKLDVLVKGVELGGRCDPTGSKDLKLRLLREIPIDPMTGRADWEVRSFQDERGFGAGGGQNVFDVHSQSHEFALDGTRYSEW
jgi:general secretion pathway protein G